MPGPDREASMRMKTILLTSAAALTVFVLHTSAPVFAQNAAALSGAVTSAKEGPMEGVVVSARKDGATITVSVVTDDKGHFRFPASRLDPGHYAISIRATGYDLDGPKDATIAAGLERAVDQRRMAHEHARHRRPEALGPRLQQLPHARTHRALDPRCG